MRQNSRIDIPLRAASPMVLCQYASPHFHSSGSSHTSAFAPNRTRRTLWLFTIKRRKMGWPDGYSIWVSDLDFAKRFERGKLTFTGDVSQVISVFDGQQKFAKLFKRLTVGP